MDRLLSCGAFDRRRRMLLRRRHWSVSKIYGYVGANLDGLGRLPEQPLPDCGARDAPRVGIAIAGRLLPGGLIDPDVIAPDRRHHREFDRVEGPLELQAPRHESGHIGVGGAMQRLEKGAFGHDDTMTELVRTDCAEVVSSDRPAVQRLDSGACRSIRSMATLEVA